MSLIERIGLKALHRFDPETAHGLALRSLQLGLAGKRVPRTSAVLKTELAGLHLPNPVGLAAGFDKNATAIAPLCNSGFGFIEIGAVTPLPQPGNPRPRLFRLTEDKAAINRFGFNNDGADVIAERLARRDRSAGVVGVNLGANKSTENKARDYAIVLEKTGPFADFATINVSSPNTERLRDLQGMDALTAVIETVLGAWTKLETPIPVFVKIAPDLDGQQLDDIAKVVLKTGVAGVFATNTTLSRDGLASHHSTEAGGLSGRPLFRRSTEILRGLSDRLDGAVPLVGVGGIFSAQDAMEKLDAGATAVQFYTAMVYEGIGLADRMVRELDTLLTVRGRD